MLYFSEFGNPAHAAIVFLHGGGGGGWMWEPQVDALQNDYHLLVPDLPEHCRSAHISPFTIADCVTKVAELIRTHSRGGKANVVGLSEGAQVTVGLLAAAPEVVDHAIISSALVREMFGISWFGAGFWAAMYRSIQPLNKYRWWMLLNMRSYGIPERFLPEMSETYKSLTANAFGHIIVENQRFRLPTGLERVTAPTLVVGGRKEFKVMRQSIRDVAAAIPSARGYLVKHVKQMAVNEEHNWNLSAPELFTRMVRAWIEEQSLPEELKALT